MNKINITLTLEEFKQLIEEAVFKATCTKPKLEYNIITENELSERLSISKVTLHKYRSEGKIPFSKIGRTIRYDYNEVIEALKKKN
tara:strand:+ start:320 stop:577 length:258 start_codon:yes stop_codon:yes gene_type:complete